MQVSGVRHGECNAVGAAGESEDQRCVPLNRTMIVRLIFLSFVCLICLPSLKDAPVRVLKCVLQTRARNA